MSEEPDGFQPLTKVEVLVELKRVIAILKAMPNEMSKTPVWSHYHHVTNLMTVEIRVESRKPNENRI